MVGPNRPGPALAAKHWDLARDYRRLAQLMLELEDSPIAAGALLYEAAKQCINAVANRQGINPATTGAKRRFLFGLAERGASAPNLLLNWRYADALHVNADRGHLSESNYSDAWSGTQAFIDQMLEIYARG